MKNLKHKTKDCLQCGTDHSNTEVRLLENSADLDWEQYTWYKFVCGDCGYSCSFSEEK